MWNSIAQVVDDFELEAVPEDRDAVIMALKRQLAALHPDVTGGDFAGDAEREGKYHRVNAALEYVRSRSTTLVPIEEVGAIAEQIANVIARSGEKPVESRITEATLRSKATASKQYHAPKISLAAVSAALGYVSLSPSVLLEHPFIGALLSGPSGTMIWATATFSLVWAWLFTWRSESRERRLIELLFSLDHQRNALVKLSNNDSKEFTRRELRHVLEESIGLGHSRILWLFRRGPERSTVEEVVDLALERFQERGWIIPVKKEVFEDWYRIQVGQQMPHGA